MARPIGRLTCAGKGQVVVVVFVLDGCRISCLVQTKMSLIVKVYEIEMELDGNRCHAMRCVFQMNICRPGQAVYMVEFY